MISCIYSSVVRSSFSFATARSSNRSAKCQASAFFSPSSRSIKSGKATAEGTARYCAEWEDEYNYPVKRNVRTQLSTSRVGFGCYRLGTQQSHHKTALKTALRGGINVIDTSTNYLDGDSEVCVGEAIEELIDQQLLKREEVVVVSKIGYIQNTNMDQAKLRAVQGKAFPEIVEVSPSVWHCMHPEFLEDQLRQSLQRLEMESLDILLLHNPEYYFHQHRDRVSRAEFYDRIHRAFQYLEKEVKRGRISSYGISSNSFPAEMSSSDFVSLSEILQTVEQSCTNFSTIQYPFNLLEGGAVLCKNQPGHVSVSQLAREKNMYQMSNRVLNAAALDGKSLFRLVSWPDHKDKDILALMKEAFDYSIAIEKEYPGLSDPRKPNKRQLFWGHILSQNPNVNNVYVWKDVLDYQIIPAMNRALEELSGDIKYAPWITRYRLATRQLFQRFTWMTEFNASKTTEPFVQKLDALCPSLARGSRSLQERALRAALCTPIDTVLVGMRTEDYVKNVLMTLEGTDPLVHSEIEELLANLRSSNAPK